VSNDLFGKKVLPVTVGNDSAAVAEKLLKDPEARNAIVKLASKDTLKTVKDEVSKAISNDVDQMQKMAAEAGNKLLKEADPQMSKQVSKLGNIFVKTFEPAIEKLDSKIHGTASKVMQEVNDVFFGRRGSILAEIGEVTSNAPKSQIMKDVRETIRQGLYVGGNPRNGIKDSLTSTETKILRAMESQTQKLFKEVPGAAMADELYSTAAKYVQAAQKNLYRKGASGGKDISNAALESFVLGKGTAGKTEDLDRMFNLRKLFAEKWESATQSKLSGAPAQAIEQGRSIMDFNRLGAGDSTGRSLAPLVTLLSSPKLAPFAFAAYNPRLYLRTLSAADNLTSSDKKVLSSIVKAVGRQKDIQAARAFSNKEGDK
jgi:hypothetical protein